MRIAVVGGTGAVGSRVVEAARERGHDVVVVARAAGVDVITGAGLAEALTGVETVIDVSTLHSFSPRKGVAFFTTATANLHAAELGAGVRHHVLLSVVGMEHAPFGYYEGKLAQERTVESGPVPWTILRATQFHEFAEQMFEHARLGGIHLAPRARIQPVAAREVAERLVELAEAAPSGRARDLAGPRVEELADMVRRFGRASGFDGPIVRMSLPTRQFAAMRRGVVLPGPRADRATQTFAEWLEEREAVLVEAGAR